MRLPTSTLAQTAVFALGVLVLGVLNSYINPNALRLHVAHINPTEIHNGGEGKGLEHGYQTASAEDVKSYLDLLYEDPPYVMMIDARSEAHYQEGHIPGSFLLDHYHQDQYIKELKPTLEESAIIVIYCTGGDCEDSIFLSNSLVYNHGVEKEKIFIFEGGVEVWEEKGYPMKEGAER
ncbi:MAG: rhodanese-like domain-containing protein [Planctomycetes bacterium]|nr:rhodanese-like domain-containing protein [Planctomycetota bacterium]MCP4770644.1 rhodanese-like domain-containing protein [Planctomycetota bacterium]MCP4861029.1 rhodanese-like domain-containing protein [Planctomycetota bacterium]